MPAAFYFDREITANNNIALLNNLWLAPIMNHRAARQQIQLRQSKFSYTRARCIQTRAQVLRLLTREIIELEADWRAAAAINMKMPRQQLN
jgi:hypothetical protein